MHSIRRAALRSALAASRQVAPKVSTSPFAAQIAFGATAAKQSSALAVRCFSWTTRTQNVEEGHAGETEPTAVQQDTRPAGGRRDPTNHGCFVRNLVFDATEEHLKTAFEKYGEVVAVSIARDARGLSKGFAFIYFNSAEEVENACANVNGSFWHGRRVNCLPKTPKEAKRGTTSPTSPTTTLYIGNIPYETTDVELNLLFRDLPNVTGIRVAVDRTTGWPRGFAHADFADVESAQKAYEKLSGLQIGERTLTIDYSFGYSKDKKGRGEPRNEEQ